MIHATFYHKNEFYFVDFIDVYIPANHSQTEQSPKRFMLIQFLSDSRAFTHR